MKNPTWCLVTQPDQRVELMTLVSDLGVPLCTVEKPISTGVSDWQALCALEALTRTHFAVCRVQEAWEIQLSGNCGKVLLKPGI